MKKEILHDDGQVTWMVFGRDSAKPDSIIDTNEYLISSQNEAILLDPGGMEIFPNVLAAVSESIEIKSITAYLCSHQDPDIMSSLPLWMELTPKAKIYLSWLWGGFVSHFGNEFSKNFVPVPDDGMVIKVGMAEMMLVPAHHLHSAGNFHLYCPHSKILFCGDVGSALLPPDYPLFVEHFKDHVPYMDKFHRRWMPSEEAKDAWLSKVRKLDISLLCPQHGAIFKGEDVERFFDWFEQLPVGRLKRVA